MDAAASSSKYHATRLAALAAGPAVLAAIVLFGPAALALPARMVLGLGAWMALWWLTEPVPLAVTALIPLALFSTLGVSSARDAAAPYASEIVFLFLAGFLLAAALESWRAHERIAYKLIALIGFTGNRVVLGLIIATGFISMWISNTATAAMMYPIAVAVGALFGSSADARRMRTALMLGIAYAASIGGIGTLIGTPPNLILAAASRQITGREIDFLSYMMIGVPIVVVLLPVTWAVLVFGLFRNSATLSGEAERTIKRQQLELGALRGGERLTLIVFAMAAFAWILRERKDFGGFVMPGLTDLSPGITDASIGIASAILLFVITGTTPNGTRRPLLTWDAARNIPWDVLLLFGGGLSLAAAMEKTELTTWVTSSLSGLQGYPAIVLYVGLAVVVCGLSELASNTAVATMAMPIAAALAVAVDQPPLMMMLVASLAASTGFALPVATPPNAIIFGSGEVRVRDMLKAGLLLDGIAILLVVAIVATLYPLVFA
jgi:sodium-dependent dicarboxylate transporter 2/3/5